MAVGGTIKKGERLFFAMTASSATLLFLLIFTFFGLRMLASRAPAPVSTWANDVGNLASYR